MRNLSLVAGQPQRSMGYLRAIETSSLSSASTESGKRDLELTHYYLTRSHLKGHMKIAVCIYGTFDYNLGIKEDFIKYLKESCWWSSEQHFSFK